MDLKNRLHISSYHAVDYSTLIVFKYFMRKLEHKWLNFKLSADYMAYKNSANKLTACLWNPNLFIITVR